MDEIEALDKVLNILATSVALKPTATVEEIIKELQKRYPELVSQTVLIVDDFASEVISMVEKLAEDGYAKIKDGKPAVYAVTFEGRLFNKQGGYRQQLITRASENTRLGNLELRQKRYESGQIFLLTLVAAGTLVAAFYYMIEIWKYLHQ